MLGTPKQPEYPRERRSFASMSTTGSGCFSHRHYRAKSKVSRWSSSTADSTSIDGCMTVPRLRNTRSATGTEKGGGMESLRAIVAAKESVEDDLLKQPGVTGVAVGYKYVGGQRTSTVAVQVFV